MSIPESNSVNSVAALAADLTDNMPRVNESIVEALTNEQSNTAETATENATQGSVSETRETESVAGTIPSQSTQSAYAGITDSKGNVFNPAMHEKMPDGSPRYSVDGEFRKKRGRKSKSVGTSDSVAVDGYVVNPTNTPKDCRGSAIFCCDLFFGMATGVFGPAWQPGQTERNNVESAAIRYFEVNQFADIPPGIALVLAVGAYAIPRLNDDETRKRMRMIGERIGVVKPSPRPAENTAPQSPNATPTPPVTPNHVKTHSKPNAFSSFG